MLDAAPTVVPGLPNPTFLYQQGVASAQQLAVFADSNTSVLSGSAAINWGDGQSETTQILGANGTFYVYAGHSYNTAGSFAITIIFTDEDGSATTGAAATVSAAVVAPVFTNGTIPTLSVGQAASFTFTTSGSPLPALSEVGALPSGLTFTDNSDGTATLAGTPAVGSSGMYYLYLTAINGGPYSTTQTYSLVVSGSASSLTLQPIADQSNAQGDSVSLQVYGSTTAGNMLYYMASGEPTGVNFNYMTGQFSGQIAAGAAGSYSTTVWASDGVSNASRTFNWDVSPRITMNNLPDQSNLEGDTIFLQVLASSPDSQDLTYSVTGAPAGVTIDPASGLLSGIIAVGAAASGPYTTTIIGAEGNYSASQSFAWGVTAPVPLTAPTITSANNKTFALGRNDGFLVTTSGTPSIVLAESGALPVGVAFTDNGDGTARLSGTPAAGTDGNYTLTLSASNGVGSAAAQAFTLTVTPDVITAAARSYTDNAGQSLDVSAANGVLTNATGGVGAPLTASVSSSPAHGTVTLSPDGSFIYVPTVGFIGSDVFYFTAADNVATSAPTAITLTVNGPGSEQNIVQAHVYATQTATLLSVSQAAGVLSDATEGVPGWPMNAEVVTDVTHGTLNLSTDGSFTYTSNNGFAGTDSFTFHATTYNVNSLTSATETVTIYVIPKGLDIVGHQAGTKSNPGAAVAESNEDDPTNLLVLTTQKPSIQIVNGTPNLVQLTLKNLNLDSTATGTVSLAASDPDPNAVRYFDSTGVLWDPSQLSVDLASPSCPSNALFRIVNSDVQIFVQILKPEADLQFVLQYEPANVTPSATAVLAAARTSDKVDLLSVGVKLDWVNYANTNVPIVYSGNADGTITTFRNNAALPGASQLMDQDVEWIARTRDQPNNQGAWLPNQTVPVAIAAGNNLFAQVHVTLVLPTTGLNLFAQSISLVGQNTSMGSPYDNMSGSVVLNGNLGGIVNVQTAQPRVQQINGFDQSFSWQVRSLVLGASNSWGLPLSPTITNAPIGITTTNRVYTLLAAPSASTAVTGMDNPWATALELATALARGATTPDEAAARMTQGIYNSTWRAQASSMYFLTATATLIYDPDYAAFKNTSLLPGANLTNGQTYDLINFLANISASQELQNCNDNSNLDAILLRALGVAANTVLIYDGTNALLQTASYYRGGTTTATTDQFDLNQVVTLTPAPVKLDVRLYDPSVRGVRGAGPGAYYLGQLDLADYVAAVFPTLAQNRLRAFTIESFELGISRTGFSQIASATVTQRPGANSFSVTLKGTGFNYLITAGTVYLSQEEPGSRKNLPFFYLPFVGGAEAPVILTGVSVVDDKTINVTLNAQPIGSFWIIVRKIASPSAPATDLQVTAALAASSPFSISTNWLGMTDRGSFIQITIP